MIENVLAKSHEMAKQKIRPTRPSGFSGVKAYVVCRGPEKPL